MEPKPIKLPFTAHRVVIWSLIWLYMLAILVGLPLVLAEGWL